MTELDELRRQNEELRQERDQLLRRVEDAEQAIEAFARGEVDAVTLEASATPVLLQAAQEQLRQSEQLLRAIFDGALDAILLADDRGMYVNANPAACALLGLPREQLVGRRIADFTAPGYDSDGAFRAFQGEGEMRGQVPLKRADGTVRILDYSAVANVAPGLHLSVLRDITARKRSEQSLQESEQRYRRLVEGSPEPILVHVDRKIAYANEASARALGVASAGALIGRSIVEFAAPATRAQIEARMASPLVNDEPLELTVQSFLRESDGREVQAEVKSIPFVYDGRPATLSMARDITARNLAEEALRASRDLLEEAQAIAHVGSWTSGIGPGDAIEWSAECYRIFGVPAGTPMTVASFFACVHPADQDSVRRASRDAAERGAPYDVEHRVCWPDGQLRWVRERATIERDALGRPTRMIGTVQDITDGHAALETRARLAAIVESSEDAILGVTLDGAITSWNLGAERLYQYSADEMVGKPISLLVPPEILHAERSVLERVGRGEAVRQYETRRRRKDGTEVEVALTASPVRSAAGVIIGASKIARDLTARRQTEAALRNSEEQRRQSHKMEAIGRLAGGVAHDFNNMLSVILSYAELALEGLKPGDPLRADLAEIHTAGQRAAELTRQLLAFSRQQVLQPRVIDLGQILEGMERMLGRLLGEDIEVTSRSAPNLGRVLADPGQIEQVVMNLAVNARDAMPRGGKLTIELANVELDASSVGGPPDVAPGRYVLLAISDNGTGMDAATRARIFEPFFTTKEQGKGTGLGLAMVFGVVQQSGGFISVYSEPGEGSVFKVYLPRTDRAADAPLSAAPPTVRGTETILLVEDEEQVRVVVCAILRRHGYRVVECSNGGEAFLLSKDLPGKIHLLLTDVVMPRMSGRMLAEQLASQRPEMNVLFVSGYTDDAIVHHGVLEAGVAFLQKPFTPDALLRKVREVLDAPASG